MMRFWKEPPILVSVVITGLETVKEASRTGVDGTHWATSQKNTYSYFMMNHLGQGGSLKQDVPPLCKQDTTLERV